MNTIRILFPVVLTAAAMLFQTACEVEVGNSEVSDNSSVATPAANPAPSSVNTGKTGGTGNNNNNTGNNNNNTGNEPTVAAPGVPSVQSPGNGERFSGAGAKATLVWTDAERAVQFEVVVQAFGSGGWQSAGHAVTDDFDYAYAFSNTAWTRYRWAVRSLGADGQSSAFTAYREFSWSP